MLKQEKHIVSFSGGKDSTCMLLKMIDEGMQIDDIIFCDTGLEFEEMYEHIRKVEKAIDRKITVLKSDKTFEYYLLEHEKTRGKNKGQKGYSFPDFRNRWCTQSLKKSVVKKYLKEKYSGDDIIEYHGIAIDEPKRFNKNKDKKVRHPLAEWNVTEADALKYCYDRGYDWGGLYEKFHRVSCWCCPLQSLTELKVLYFDYPKKWEKLKEWQNKTYRKFRIDYSLEELEQKFQCEARGEKYIKNK